MAAEKGLRRLLMGAGAAAITDPGNSGEAKMSSSPTGIGLLPKPLAAFLEEDAGQDRGAGEAADS